MSLTIDSFVAIPMTPDLYARLANRYPGGAAGIVEQVVVDFLDRTEEDFSALNAQRDFGGVKWDNLTLPNGTQLRTKYYGSYNVAEVENDKVVWDGEEYASVAQAANAMRGNTNNNAWRALEVKRPQDANWHLADRLRK